MSTDRIAAASTIETVWDGLTHQRSYVAGVLAKMRKCMMIPGNAFVRIGVTGTGQKPYYRIFSVDGGGVETIFGSYYNNHDSLENAFAPTQNWSTQAMSYQTLEDFFAKRIGYAGSRPK